MVVKDQFSKNDVFELIICYTEYLLSLEKSLFWAGSGVNAENWKNGSILFIVSKTVLRMKDNKLISESWSLPGAI